jgi:hypothetical protein
MRYSTQRSIWVTITPRFNSIVCVFDDGYQLSIKKWMIFDKIQRGKIWTEYE